MSDRRPSHHRSGSRAGEYVRTVTSFFSGAAKLPDDVFGTDIESSIGCLGRKVEDIFTGTSPRYSQHRSGSVSDSRPSRSRGTSNEGDQPFHDHSHGRSRKRCLSDSNAGYTMHGEGPPHISPSRSPSRPERTSPAVSQIKRWVRASSDSEFQPCESPGRKRCIYDTRSRARMSTVERVPPSDPGEPWTDRIIQGSRVIPICSTVGLVSEVS
jgi:hypothetical protein